MAATVPPGPESPAPTPPAPTPATPARLQTSVLRPPAAPPPPRRARLPWIAGAVAALLALLGLAAWLGPGLLDWGAWRPQIAEIASARLGRPVALGGRVTLALLPQPGIEAAEVTIGSAGDGLRVDARAMRLRLDLGALVAGRLEPREIAIIGGEIRLPWPPADLPSFRAPAWLTALDARLEDCRLLVGGLTLEGLNARLVTGGVTEALVADGRFAWRGQAVRFSAQLGRAGFDGAAPLELTMAAAGATVSARGVLAPGGGFEGRMDAAGSDLSALLPAPAMAFRASGRLSATEEVIAGVDLGLDLGGQPARGAVALRLVPEPRLDIALVAGRLDLESWIAAARHGAAAARAIPVGIDLSAEATALREVPIRRLRGAFFLDGDRLSLSDVSGVLPGGAEVELAGATAGPRLELGIRFAATRFRETLAALGLPLDGIVDPARLGAAQGRLRLALQDGQAALSDIAIEIDGAKLAGAGSLRLGARPVIGLGLSVDRLDLDGLLPAEAPDWAALPARLGGFDLNLRLAAEEVLLRAASGVPIRRAALDASLEGGRLALRRLGMRLGELDLALAGTAALGPGPMRLSDLSLEVGGTADAALQAALLPAAWEATLPDGLPLALRVAGGGTAEALALRAEGDLGELRLEAQGTLDLPGRKGAGAITLRHPGAPRLLAPLLGQDRVALADWLGQGSFSLITTLAAGPQGIAAEQLDLVAAGLRARGRLALSLAEPRPRLIGRLAAESLPLPDPRAPEAGPVTWQRLAGFDAEVALAAGRVEMAGAAVLEEATGAVALNAGRLIVAAKGRFGGGALDATMAAGFADPARPPDLALEASLADVTIGAPLLGLPLDLGAGRLRVAARLAARGHGFAGILGSLGGEATVAVRDGQLAGYDLAAVQAAAALPELQAAEAALRAALSAAGGATPFERLEATARIADGVATLERAELGTERGGSAMAEGRIDLARGTLDLTLSAAPIAGAPPIGLRLTGPAGAPRRQPALVPFLKWKAEQG